MAIAKSPQAPWELWIIARKAWADFLEQRRKQPLSCSESGSSCALALAFTFLYGDAELTELRRHVEKVSTLPLLFSCFEDEGVFIAGHFIWLPGPNVFACLLSEILTPVFCFMESLLSTDNSALELSSSSTCYSKLHSKNMIQSKTWRGEKSFQ